MSTQGLLEWIDTHSKCIRLVAAPILVAMVAGVYVLVYWTGGIEYVYSHSMYVPILLGGFIYGVRGGILIGILGGLVLGPYMPINTITGQMQEPINWIYRTGFFVLIGYLSGFASDTARSYVGYIKWFSNHNDDTQLPNLKALLNALTAIGDEQDTSHQLILAVFSIENADELKSAFGFAVVSESVLQLAKRFADSQSGRDVYHTDTAHIAILIDRNGLEPKAIADELMELASEPVNFKNIPIHIDGCLGYVPLSPQMEAAEVEFQRAEEALTAASAMSHEQMAYSPDIRITTEENLSILGELKSAVGNGEVSLHYQPKVLIDTGAIHGVEGLMRWHHPTFGTIPPGKFIPRAEQSTLIHMVTEFALNEAMGRMVQWRKCGLNIPIAVNVSARDLVHPGFADSILTLLDSHGLNADALELEITEGVFMLDMQRAIDELVKLANAKVTIAIDDFGTGYSSLQYLHRFPIAVIKIDQTFVKRIPADEGAAHIVKAAVSLAHRMGIRALAEGVETREVFDFLGDIGCDLVQGYLIAPALPTDRFLEWHDSYSGVHRPKNNVGL